MQERTQSLKAEVDYYAGGLLTGLADLDQREATFREQLLRSEEKFQSAWEYNEDEKPGFRYRLKLEKKKVGAANEQWSNLAKARETYSANEQKYKDKLRAYNDLKYIDNSLSVHSKAGYVWTPIILFIAALASFVWFTFHEAVKLISAAA